VRLQMKIFMRDWVEREYSLDEARITLTCGCKVHSLKDALSAKWVDVQEDGEQIVAYGVVCNVCFYVMGCEHAY